MYGVFLKQNFLMASTTHQELLLIPYLSVAENIFLGREPLDLLRLLDKKKLLTQAKALLEGIGIEIDPAVQMRTLSVAQIRLVEIAKAVSFQSKILIMDEPTSAISAIDIALWDILGKKAQLPVYKLLGAAKTNLIPHASAGYYLEGKSKMDCHLSIGRTSK